MNNNLKNRVMTVLFAVILLVTTVVCWIKPETAFSESERRPLAAKPEFSASTVTSGEFMNSFEEYTVDQFPLRDKFRTIKALFNKNILGKKDNNNIFTANGHISKIEYPQNSQMIEIAADKFCNIYNSYLKQNCTNIYLSIVPDKNCFLAENNGYLSLDYDNFIKEFRAKVSFMKYIDIVNLLSLDDYYRTDSHWKQECIVDVAEHLATEMGTNAASDYTQKVVSENFYGVYAGQSALPVKPDKLSLLTNDTLKNCIVTYFDSGLPQLGEMYNMQKAHGKDPYEMFLNGTSPLITIENPSAKSDKELIIFRDSFGSSLAPLLAEGYKKITVVDIRYIQSSLLGSFIDFAGQDVLFIYSTTLLNNSTALR